MATNVTMAVIIANMMPTIVIMMKMQTKQNIAIGSGNIIDTDVVCDNGGSMSGPPQRKEKEIAIMSFAVLLCVLFCCIF